MCLATPPWFVALLIVSAGSVRLSDKVPNDAETPCTLLKNKSSGSEDNHVALPGGLVDILTFLKFPRG